MINVTDMEVIAYGRTTHACDVWNWFITSYIINMAILCKTSIINVLYKIVIANYLIM